jgi:hypothetical protein
MRSSPALNSYSNFSVFDLDVVGSQLDREIELVLAGSHVVLPAVPRAGQDAALEPAVTQRPAEVEAVRLDGVEAAFAVGERDLLVTGSNGSDISRRQVLGARDGHK